MPHSTLPVCGLVLGAIATLAAAPPALAQLVPDATLGAESSTVTPNATVQGNLVELIGGGAVQGNNLFHSFLEFNVDAGQRVYFANPAGVEAIFSRVTGGNPSNIFGTLGVDGTADLFLMNPNGLVFGPGARLDVQGAFTATTASAIQFGDQGSFGAADPTPLPILTVDPSALWFNQLSQGAITSQGILLVDEGQSLILAGGDITLDNSFLFVDFFAGGRIELGAVAGEGAVELAKEGSLFSLAFPEDLERGDIAIANRSILDVSTDNGGDIAITGRNITISDSIVFAGIASGLGNQQSQAGNIKLDASETLRVEANSLVNNDIAPEAIGNAGAVNINANNFIASQSEISATAVGSGNAGNINILVNGDIVLDAANVFSLGSAGVTANAGDITVETTNLSLMNGAQISASTFGVGVPGNVVINGGDRVNLDGFPSAIFSSTFGSSPAQGGDIQITAREFSLTNSAKLDTSVNGQGAGGNVIINTQDGVFIDGIIQGRPGSSIFSTIEEEATGTAGNVIINSGFVSITNSGNIQSLVRGQGDAGDIFIRARDFVALDGFGTQGTTTIPGIDEPVIIQIPSAIASIVTDDENASGNGGDIYIRAGNYISLSDTARIESGIESETAIGNAGSITLVAGSVFMDEGRIDTTTVAQGNSGEITINARDRVAVNNRSRIQSSTNGAGNAGSIMISTLGQVSFNDDSTIVGTVERNGKGSAGNIIVDSASLTITSGSQFIASTFGEGNAGDVVISVADSAILSGRSAGNFPSGIFTDVGSQSTGKGGGISIAARSLLFSEGRLSTSTQGNGNGGNILLDIEELTALDNTLVSTGVDFGARGNGGNIQVNTGTLTATNFGAFESDTDGFGNAGDITLDVRGDAQFSGAIIANSRIRSSGASSSVTRNGVGNAGTIRLTANSVSLTDVATLQTSTLGQGNGGDIVVEAAGRIFLDDARLVAIVGDGTDQSRVGNGNGGTIRVRAQDLSLVNGAQFQASTFGNGNAGDIEIDVAETVSLSGEVPFRDNFFRSALFSIVGFNGIGEGGNISVRTGNLSVAAGAVMSTTTAGQGPAGNIQVEARDRITVDGYSTQSGFPSTLQTSTEFPLSGLSGNIDLSASQVEVLNGGQVLANSEGQSPAGTVRVNATDSILVSGSNPTFAAQAARNSNIERLFVPQSAISVRSSAEGAAGNVIIGDLGNTPRLVLDGGQLIAESAAVDGGNIVIDLSQVLLLRNGSLISTTAGTAQAGGNGGNIAVRAPFIVAIPGENSDIRADAFAGAGGNVSVTARGIFGIEPRLERSPLSDITATSALGVSGVVTVDTLDTSFIESNLSALEDALVDTAALTSGSCIARTEPGLGAFTITGGGGLPLSPGDGAISAYPTGTVRTVEEPTASAIQEPDGVYQLPDGRLVLSRRCADRSAPSG